MVELSGRELLKMMAQQAKNRMRDKSKYQESGRSAGKNFRMIIGGQKLEYKTIIITNEENEKLYNKVKDMLINEGDICNPLDKIMDIKVYNKLSASGKEKYMLDLAQKYREFKNKFESEQLAKTV